MTQTRWLNRIVVLDRRYEGRHMARNCRSIRAAGDLVTETSIRRTRLKSVIPRVEPDSRDGYEISGAAWSGPEAWSLWKLDWPDTSPGAHTLTACAVEDSGQVQLVQSEFVSSREDHAQWPRRVVIPAR